MSDPVVTPRGFAHVRLAVTDIHRSEAFYRQPLPVFGLVILSVQDPDDVDLELAAPHPGGEA